MIRCDESEYLWFDTTRQMQRQAASLRAPISGTFEITSRCNLRCRMCYVSRKADDVCSRAKEKTAGEWISLAEQAVRQGTLFLLLTGGEPFLRPDFREIYQSIAQMGFIITIYTNATLITPKVMEWLSMSPPNRVGVTLYGTSRDTYAAVTGYRDAYDKAIQGIDHLLSAGIHTNVRMTVIRENMKDVVQAREYIKGKMGRLDISTLMAKPVRGAESNAEDVRLSPKEIMEVDLFDDGSDAVDNQGDMQTDLEKSRMSQEVMFCAGGKCSYWVAWDGRMLPCSLMDHPYALPFDTGLAAAWEKIKEDTRAIAGPAACGTCAFRSYCSICPGRLQAETGSFEKLSPYICEMAKYLYGKYHKEG
jgi:radical SAM protein with 4Fe4S-binding SPASM domain